MSVTEEEEEGDEDREEAENTSLRASNEKPDEEKLIARQVDYDSSEDDDNNDDDNAANTNRYWPPPTQETVEILGSSACKTISALTINNSGTRFAAGGHDYEVRIWDFGVLDKSRVQPINTVQPCGPAIIKQLEFSANDELILVISGNCQATIIGKDGISKNHPVCPKGDQYLVDMNKTKGHVQMLNDGCWNPKDSREFLTCSNDATLRLWDLNKMSEQKSVIKTRSPTNGLKAVPSVCKYSRDGLSIVAGCSDGSIMFWDTRRKFFSPSNCIKNAHLKGSEITGVDFCYTTIEGKIVSRSEDESCKLWDLRQMKQALAVRTGLGTLHSAQDCCFSPDDKFVLIGTSHSNSNEPGQLVFLDCTDLSTQQAIDVTGASVLRVRWHAKINHLAYSGSDGQVRVAYDRRRSLGGFMLEEGGFNGSTKKRKKYMMMSTGSGGVGGGVSMSMSVSTSIKKIITPHALPLFRDDRSRGVGASRGTGGQKGGDLKRAYRPELPTSTSADGRVKPAGSTLSSYIARNIAKPIDKGGMNIRDRILRHAEEAEREPLWISSSTGSSGAGATAAAAVAATSATLVGCSVASSATSSATAQNHPKRPSSSSSSPSSIEPRERSSWQSLAALQHEQEQTGQQQRQQQQKWRRLEQSQQRQSQKQQQQPGQQEQEPE